MENSEHRRTIFEMLAEDEFLCQIIDGLGESSSEPRWSHNCPSCKWVGQLGSYDVWLHREDQSQPARIYLRFGPGIRTISFRRSQAAAGSISAQAWEMAERKYGKQ